MRKAILTWLFYFICATMLAQSNGRNTKLTIKVNYNVELLGLAYFIGFEGVDIEKKTVEINGRQLPKKQWHAYGYYIYEKYKQYAASQNLAQSFAVADHLWLDYIINLLIQVDDFPNARITPDIDVKYFIGFSVKKDTAQARRNVIAFLDGLNKFYNEINFKQYIADTKIFYDAALAEVKASLPKTAFVSTMENFYNQRFDQYVLVPSLAIPKGMGFGLNYSRNGSTLLFNVFGAFDYQQIQTPGKLNLGFKNPERVRELSIHEFGHSFVNHIVDSISDERITKTIHLFDTVKTRMAEQGYNTWKACLYEHFVRAGEVVIAKLMGDKTGRDRLYAEYVNNRKFIYLPVIVSEFEKISKAGTFSSHTLNKIMDELIVLSIRNRSNETE